MIKHAIHDNDLFLHMSSNVNEVIWARKVPEAQRRNQAKHNTLQGNIKGMVVPLHR